MRSYIRHIGVLDTDEHVHSVAFTTGVNVITGRSSTGKSALIEIFDFCFGSSDFTVPEGVITKHADVYFVVIRVNETDLVLGRRRDEKKAFLKVENDTSLLGDVRSLNSSYFEAAYFWTLDDFKKSLAQWFGMTITDVDEDLNEKQYRGGKKKPTPSVRSFTSYVLQHQNLVANKHAIFYRFEEKEKREQAIEHFKIFMGFADQKYFMKAQELNLLKSSQKSLEQQIPRAAMLKERSKQRLSEELSSYRSISGNELEIGDLNKALANPQSALDYLQLLKVDVVSLSDDHARMRQTLEVDKAKLIGELRRNHNKLASIRSSIDFSKSYTEDAATLLIPDEAIIAISTCPFCENHETSLVGEANKLSEAINWLNSELSRSKFMLSSFEEEEANVTRSINERKTEIRAIEERIAVLDKHTAQLQRYRSQYELALKVKLRVERILEDLLEKPDVKLQEELDAILKRTKEIRKFLKDNYNIEERLRKAEQQICSYMDEIGPLFEFEESYRPIKLRFSLETFDLWHEGPDRNVFLRSMGSGANWLSCHLTLFLALHRYFCTLGDSCSIPSILFFDQPSQVYFPSILDTGEKFEPEKIADKVPGEKIRAVDEDIRAVANLYTQLVKFCESVKDDVGFEPQIIVTDHADNLELEGDRSFESLVAGRRWRAKEDGFIKLSKQS